MRRRKIRWDAYVDEIVIGLRERETAGKLAKRVHARYGIELTDGNIYGAMRENDGRGMSDGPLVRLLRSRYPTEVAGLLRTFRHKGKRNGNGTPPRWLTRLTPEQLEAYYELQAEAPAPDVVFRCGWLVEDAELGEEVPCGCLAREAFCRTHYALGYRWMVSELLHRMRDAA